MSQNKGYFLGLSKVEKTRYFLKRGNFLNATAQVEEGEKKEKNWLIN